MARRKGTAQPSAVMIPRSSGFATDYLYRKTLRIQSPTRSARHRQHQPEVCRTHHPDNGIYSIRASNYATGRLKAPVDSAPIVIAVTLPENTGTAIRAKTIKLKDPEKTAYGALGGTVLVEATITDAPSKTKYVWQKLQTDGTTWVDQKKFTKPLLKMQRATYADSGYYRLRAYYGEDESCTTAVAISILPPAWVSLQPVDSEGLEGQPHTIAADIGAPLQSPCSGTSLKLMVPKNYVVQILPT